MILHKYTQLPNYTCACMRARARTHTHTHTDTNSMRISAHVSKSHINKHTVKLKLYLILDAGEAIIFSIYLCKAYNFVHKNVHNNFI
jgi:hypothetical protein